MRLILIGMIAVLLPLSAFAGCPADRQVTTRDGFYGTTSENQYSAMARALDSRDQARIDALIQDNRAVRVPAGEPACLLNQSYVSTRAQIRIESTGQALWVPKMAFDKAS